MREQRDEEEEIEKSVKNRDEDNEIKREEQIGERAYQ